MKTITIKQPWASLICEGIKDIENRTWKTKFRGRVLVHASKKSIDFHNPNQIFTEEQFNSISDKVNAFCNVNGAIIGSVEIVDCVINHASIWAEKTPIQWMKNAPSDYIKYIDKPTYNWVIAHPILFQEPIPIKGKQSFWDYPNILSETEEKHGDLFCHCQLPVKEENQVRSIGDGKYECRYCGGKWYK